MDIILTEVSRTIPQAYVYYGIRIIVYTLVAVIGIFCGIKLRKRKNAKDDKENA